MTTFTATTSVDTLVGGAGDDVFIVFSGDGASPSNPSATLNAGDVFNGGMGNDTLSVAGLPGSQPFNSYDFTQTTILSVETLSLSNPSTSYALVLYFDSAQFGAGLSNSLNVDGGGDAAWIYVNMSAPGVFTTADWTFTNFSQCEVRISGSTGTDTITVGGAYVIGFSVDGGNGNDVIDGSQALRASLGGSLGDDTLIGATGGILVQLYGGEGNDTYVLPSTGSNNVHEHANEGIDTIQTDASSFNLGASINYANIENLTFIGSGAFSGTGNALDNVISGGGISDTINGAGGVDTFRANYAGYSVSIPVAITASTSSVSAGLATVATLTNVERLDITAGSGADSLTGGAYGDRFDSSSGNDTLDGGAGADTLIGGAGDDLYIVDSALDVVTELAGGGADTIRTALNVYTLTAANVENVIFTGAGAVTLTGNSGANSLTGGSDNDTFRTGGGLDTLIGGLGDDLYVISEAGVTITEASAEGTDTVRTSLAAYTLGANVENLTLVTTALNGFGNAENNVITGNANANVLKGFGGDDTLDGAAGNDTVSYTGAGGAVTASLLAGSATGEGSDTLISIENLTGSTFNDSLTGDANANVLNGFDGADTLDGGAGADTLAGGLGDDVYVIDSSDVIVEAAGAGIDTIRTALNVYTLTAANVENLTFIGAGDATLTGSLSSNTITGGAGNDTFRTGGGLDTLIGGLGDDLYVISEAGVTITEASAEGTDTVRTSLAAYTLGANVENLTLVTTALNGFGNAENNVITGNANANVLKGFGGDDTLDGAAGNDTVSYTGAGGAVTASLLAGSATGEGSDTLISIENLTGSTFNDSLTGDANANVLNGFDGNDTLDGGAGADTLAGGLGDDVYVIDSSDVIVEAAGAGNDTIRTALNVYTLTAANVENVVFTGAGAATLTGNAGANSLTGGASGDTFRTGGGLDTLIGGLGDDLYVISEAGVTITEASGEGTDTVRTSLTTYTLGANVENLVLVNEAVTGIGNAENNEITGHAGANSLSGLGGADTLRSGGGADTLIGGLGDDLYVIAGAAAVVTELSGEGTDTVRTSLATYTLSDNVENLVLVGDALNGFGNTEDNQITGNANANVLKGFGGNDTLDGGLGNDTASYTGALGAVTASLQAGTATGDGNDTLISIENLTGSIHNDSLTGDVNANVLNGFDGDDTLYGGLGNDILAGGAGADVFVFNTAPAAGNVDRITDFTAGTDRVHLDLSIFSALGGAGTLAPGAFRTGAAALDADDRILYNATTGALFYDADGSDNGSAAIQFATLNPGLMLVADDFQVI